jgi:hypothetical protein
MTAVTTRRPLWFKATVAQGTLAQAVAVMVALGLLVVARRSDLPDTLRLIVAIGGTVLIYLNTHAVAHWAVGRALGICFTGYGVGGTDKAHRYPPPLRQLMTHAPFWVAITRDRDKDPPWRRAVMTASGQTSTIVTTLAAAAYLRAAAPGGRALFAVVASWLAVATAFAVALPEGEFRRAARLLR